MTNETKPICNCNSNEALYQRCLNDVTETFIISADENIAPQCIMATLGEYFLKASLATEMYLVLGMLGEEDFKETEEEIKTIAHSAASIAKDNEINTFKEMAWEATCRLDPETVERFGKEEVRASLEKTMAKIKERRNG